MIELKRRQIQVLRRAGARGRRYHSERRVRADGRRVGAEAAVTTGDNEAERARRQVGRHRQRQRIATSSCRR
jgi:hypothetical protein